MIVEKEYEWTGDIDAPLVTVTVSAIEALNMECAHRGHLHKLIENKSLDVFIRDAEQTLFEWKTIYSRAADNPISCDNDCDCGCDDE